MERVGIAADTEHLERLSSAYGAEVNRSAQAAYEAVGHEFNLGSPKQLQVVLFEELRLPKTKRIKTGYTTDADALAWLALQSDHPVIPALLRHRDVARLKTVVDSLIPMVDSSRPDPHHVQPDDRRHRPAVVDRSQPAEHPGAHGRGSPDPRGVHRRGRLRVPADRRLQPDRDADHGPSLAGRRADRGVHLGRRPAHLGGVAGARSAARRGRSGAAAPDQGDVLRARVRAVGLRARRAARHPAR